LLLCCCVNKALHVALVKLVKLVKLCLTAGVVGEELQKAVDERSLPPWIWFMWIPQLLTSLTRPETHRVKPILKQLAEVSGSQTQSNMVKLGQTSTVVLMTAAGEYWQLL
jgi:hypothetical protein